MKKTSETKKMEELFADLFKLISAEKGSPILANVEFLMDVLEFLIGGIFYDSPDRDQKKALTPKQKQHLLEAANEASSDLKKYNPTDPELKEAKERAEKGVKNLQSEVAGVEPNGRDNLLELIARREAERDLSGTIPTELHDENGDGGDQGNRDPDNAVLNDPQAAIILDADGNPRQNNNVDPEQAERLRQRNDIREQNRADNRPEREDRNPEHVMTEDERKLAKDALGLLKGINKVVRRRNPNAHVELITDEQLQDPDYLKKFASSKLFKQLTDNYNPDRIRILNSLNKANLLAEMKLRERNPEAAPKTRARNRTFDRNPVRNGDIRRPEADRNLRQPVRPVGGAGNPIGNHVPVAGNPIGAGSDLLVRPLEVTGEAVNAMVPS